jgi:hypothetical protein
LDGGISNDAPVGWEVRDPGKKASCGPPGEHLYEEPPAPGCSGKSIVVDARGEWDCYAVQTVSPYNSIEGGATYVVRAVVRSEGNSVNPAAWFLLGAQWLDDKDTFFGDEKNPKTTSAVENDHDWKVLEWELTAPPQARRILLWLSAHYPGKVTFDHVAVYRK